MEDRSLATRLGTYVINRPWRVMILTLLMVMVAASGARWITFENDLRVFFSKENPHLQAFEALEDKYNRNLWVEIGIETDDNNIFTRETLAAIEELTERCWRMPYSRNVISLSNYQHTQAAGDDLMVADLVQNARELSDADIRRIRETALNDIILRNYLVAADGSAAVMFTNIEKPNQSLREVPEIVTYVRELERDMEAKYPHLNLHLTGGVMIDNALAEAAQKDMSTLIPAMYLVMFVIIIVSLRSVVGAVVTFMVLICSMLFGVGMAGWLGIALTPISANAPNIILTLAVADSIHMLETIFHQMQLGKSKKEAIVESYRVNLGPVFLTSLSTAIGFLALNFSEVPPFRDMGNIVTLGVTAAFLISIFFLPAFITVVPVRIQKHTKPTRVIFEKLSRLVVRRQKGLIVTLGILVVALSLGILRIELNDDFDKYYDEKLPFRQATDFVEARVTGFDNLEYSLKAGGSNDIYDPQYLALVDRFAQWFRQQPHVAHVYAITDILKRLNKNMHGDDEAFYRIPESRELAAQYYLLYEMSLPFGHDVNNRVNVDKSESRFSVLLRGVDNQKILDLDRRAQQWLAQNAPASMHTIGTGLSTIFAHLSMRNIKSMIQGSLMALLLVSVILTISLRSFRMGLISLIPNLAPAFMAMGIWGLLVGEAGLSVSVIVALTVGIVVDDTVHFLSKFHRARTRLGMQPEAAVQYAFTTVGKALFTTTLIVAAGFVVLGFSGFKINADMGLMTVITILLALGLDFFFLPALLLRLEARKAVTASSADEASVRTVRLEEAAPTGK